MLLNFLFKDLRELTIVAVVEIASVGSNEISAFNSQLFSESGILIRRRSRNRRSSFREWTALLSEVLFNLPNAPP